MNNKYFEERESLIKEIKSELTEFVSGGGGDDVCDQYIACERTCRLEFSIGDDEREDCFEDCLDTFPCDDEMD